MEVKIEKLDHQGRGIAHVDGKITFIENALKDEVVDIDIVNATTKYMEGVVKGYKSKSPKRTKSKCPYYEVCGGCQLRHLSYNDTLEFKKNKLEEILSKYAGIQTNIEIVKNKNKDFYRNKVEIHVQNGEYGFYKKGSHEIVACDRCLNVEEAINGVLLAFDLLHLENGKVTIKSNYNEEIILSIETEDKTAIEIEKLRDKIKLVGILVNGELIFGADHFIEIVDGLLFKETYNSFFQINRYINEFLFEIVKENVSSSDIVLDMCSGVGTLSIIAALKAKRVYGVEIVENAVRDALVNAKMNRIENVHFILGDAFKTIDKIRDEITTVLIDPPRSGLSEEGLAKICAIEPKKIVYISCNPVTLARDLKEFQAKYDIEKVYLLDMFSYTHHVETVCVLSKR